MGNADILGGYAWQLRGLAVVFQVAARTREQFGVLDFEATHKWIIPGLRRRMADKQQCYKELRTVFTLVRVFLGRISKWIVTTLKERINARTH